MVELETLFDAHRRDPNTTDVLDSGEEYDEEDEDEDEEEEDDEEEEGEDDDSVHENPTENGAPSTPSLSGSAPDFSDDLAVYAAVCARVYEDTMEAKLQHQIFARARAMLDFLETPLSEDEGAGAIKDSSAWNWKSLHAGLLLIRRARASCPATSPSPAGFDAILSRFALIFAIICTHPAGLVLRPLMGQTVNGFFAPKTAGARAPSSPVLERLRGVLTRVLVITTLRGHSAGSTLDIQNSRRWLSAYLVFRGSIDGGKALCGLQGCGHILVPPPPGELLFRNSKRQFRLSVMSIRWRRVCSGDGLHKTLRCSAIYPSLVKIWRWHFNKILLLDWADLGRVVHLTCKLFT
jgi:hypothetical protein